MNTTIRKIIDDTFDQQVEDLKTLVSFPSVSRGTPEPGMPLGRHVDGALNAALTLAKKLGFPNARSLDGYCGLVDYGEGDEMLMIMAHIDVVPAGPAWKSDPFRAEIRDGRMYGRGVIDDKGPLVSTLYALHAVKEAGIPLKRRVRILMGCDEEVDWACINRYKQTEPEPDLAFTPDGDYPVVHSEMSICHAEYTLKLTGSDVRIDCGIASNVVPGEAVAELSCPAVPVRAPKTVNIAVDGNRITVTGRGGHAAMPDLAVNALCYLFDALTMQQLSPEDLSAATALHAMFGYDLHGEGFGLDVSDDSGRLTLQPTMVRWDENGVKVTLDCRHPLSLTEEELQKKLDETFGAVGFARASFKDSLGHYIAPDSELVSTLLDIYAEHSGQRLPSEAIGGGTYARAFKNAVAFGAEPHNAPAEAHMPDESTGLEEMRFNTVVIADAITRLAGK